MKATAITIPASGYPNGPLLIWGTGSGTELAMQTAEASRTLFDISDAPNVTFQDLKVSFGPPFEQTGTDFSFNGGAGHKLFRVNVENRQYPVVIGRTDGVAITRCEFNYFDAVFRK